jgi:hypothetical protein
MDVFWDPEGGTSHFISYRLEGGMLIYMCVCVCVCVCMCVLTSSQDDSLTSHIWSKTEGRDHAGSNGHEGPATTSHDGCQD